MVLNNNGLKVMTIIGTMTGNISLCVDRRMIRSPLCWCEVITICDNDHHVADDDD